MLYRFFTEITSLGKGIPEKNIKNAYTELIMGQSLDKVLKKNLIIDIIGLNLEDIQKVEKKRAKKSKTMRK